MTLSPKHTLRILKGTPCLISPFFSSFLPACFCIYFLLTLYSNPLQIFIIVRSLNLPSPLMHQLHMNWVLVRLFPFSYWLDIWTLFRFTMWFSKWIYIAGTETCLHHQSYLSSLMIFTCLQIGQFLQSHFLISISCIWMLNPILSWFNTESCPVMETTFPWVFPRNSILISLLVNIVSTFPLSPVYCRLSVVSAINAHYLQSGSVNSGRRFDRM